MYVFTPNCKVQFNLSCFTDCTEHALAGAFINGQFIVFLSGLHMANSSWQTRVGKPKLVCVNGTKTGGKHVCKLLGSNRNVFADCFYVVHTHQLAFVYTNKTKRHLQT